MIKKKINKLSLISILFISVFCILCNIEIYEYFSKIKLEKLIINRMVTPNKELVSDIKSNNNEEIYEEYLGYISIEKYNINKAIMLGTSDSILNKNVVGLYDGFSLLDEESGNTILAGHNNKYVFNNLFKVQIKDEITIYSRINTYKYVIYDIKTVNSNDYSIFKTSDSLKMLTIITCISSTKRLVVMAYLK